MAKDSAVLSKIQNCLNAAGQSISHNVASRAREIKVPYHQVRYACDRKLKLRSFPEIKGARMSEKNVADRKSLISFRRDD